ncbi:uncharacterized protein BCR38DRAFT_457553 [Pseudomassariella vexata]|uniref:Uncharacterized protein n=1 Tax=Pseudomassariella vexata TaxID=1141098 RepID=A0A1Y2E3D9_9PEZI|nr:uncharacterized protein BCR38DRAFT_457553 [Pseudomassariella vexata]ORY65385.1 hypothetical protein BCR38DRAFT_457553 [Pseudomassariella vexata]
MSLAPAADIQKGPGLSLREIDHTATAESASGSAPLSRKATNLETGKTEAKPKKRSLFGFGKKKTDDNTATMAKTVSKADANLPSSPPTNNMTQLSSHRSTTTSPTPLDTPHMIPSSPGRSPRLASPAGSQIFERDVQESAVAMPASPAIPSHIQVENYIPPALDASSEAITDGHLNPDSVEIVTHASHQPASVTVTGTSPYDMPPSSWVDELASLAEKEEAASNYGSLDSADVRRLSFISFADVVQAEHGPHGGAGGSRESMHLAGLTSLNSGNINRSPSPIRSPISSQGPEMSPPTSKSGSFKGLDMSPSRKPLGSSATSTKNTLGVCSSGDLNIETMSQALRRTGSADLSAARSLPISPIEGPFR